MAPAKRARPDFSPPRPSNTTVVPTAMKGREPSWKNQKNAAIARRNAGVTKQSTTPARKHTTPARKNAASSSRKNSTNVARIRKRPPRMEDDEDDDDESDAFEDNGRSALALVDMQAGEDNESDSDEQEQDDSDQDGDDDDNDPQRHSSPEPDMMLAEITTTNEPSPNPIPEKLVHRLLVHHFEHGERTKISTDARDLVSRYIEVFVREAIMRSAYERDERQSQENGGGAGAGFLEVEDLERAAVQLCLDF